VSVKPSFLQPINARKHTCCCWCCCCWCQPWAVLLLLPVAATEKKQAGGDGASAAERMEIGKQHTAKDASLQCLCFCLYVVRDVSV